MSFFDVPGGHSITAYNPTNDYNDYNNYNTPFGQDESTAASAILPDTDNNDIAANELTNANSEQIQSQSAELQPVSSAEEPEEAPVIDIVINNVVCSFATKCHLNLKQIALEGYNLEYKREQGMISMKLRKPHTTASIWSSGKATVTGASSEEDSHKAARRVARILQKMGYSVKFCRFKVVNVLGTCTMPFAIRITAFSRDHREDASYEPELHPGVTYKIKSPKATLKIFSTGSITITAPSVSNVQSAVEHIFPLVYNYQMDKKSVPKAEIQKVETHMFAAKPKKSAGYISNKAKEAYQKYLNEDSDDEDIDEDEAEIDSDDDFDSDSS
ncbi:unnamed protein product [Owenia fusiformis]|uniref:TATA box-binding protein-like 1 n=1 Tax=Owenia fusiformis TaxID=6347 RepID=A0A8J1XP58_OWEFU|nr:unnamed protein product [Owenia fusiformis]